MGFEVQAGWQGEVFSLFLGDERHARCGHRGSKGTKARAGGHRGSKGRNLHYLSRSVLAARPNGFHFATVLGTTEKRRSMTLILPCLSLTEIFRFVAARLVTGLSSLNS